MRQTTHTGRPKATGPLADAGPYDYDLPVARGGGNQPQPHAAKSPAPKGAVGTGLELFGYLAVTFSAPWLHELIGWRRVDSYIVLYAALTLIQHVSKPRPKEGFLRWALKTAGIWLNCYVAFITVPLSLRGLIPEPLAFGLPAFIITAILYCVAPDKPHTGRKWPLWQWLVFALWVAVFWGWGGPVLVE